MGVRDRSTWAVVRVIKGREVSLLGKAIASEMGVFKVGITIAMVTSKANKFKQ